MNIMRLKEVGRTAHVEALAAVGDEQRGMQRLRNWKDKSD